MESQLSQASLDNIHLTCSSLFNRIKRSRSCELHRFNKSFCKCWRKKSCGTEAPSTQDWHSLVTDFSSNYYWQLANVHILQLNLQNNNYLLRLAHLSLFQFGLCLVNASMIACLNLTCHHVCHLCVIAPPRLFKPALLCHNGFCGSVLRLVLPHQEKPFFSVQKRLIHKLVQLWTLCFAQPETTT